VNAALKLEEGALVLWRRGGDFVEATFLESEECPDGNTYATIELSPENANKYSEGKFSVQVLESSLVLYRDEKNTLPPASPKHLDLETAKTRQAVRQSIAAQATAKPESDRIAREATVSVAPRTETSFFQSIALPLARWLFYRPTKRKQHPINKRLRRSGSSTVSATLRLCAYKKKAALSF
jgi:hypothetical protein